MLQLRNSFKKISPCSTYLFSLILPIYWLLILKLRCLVILDWDFGLNNIISVLLAFNDILFALSQMFSSFKSWLMCLFIFFSDLSDSSRFVSSAKWCTSLYLIALLCRRGTVKDPRQIREGLHNWYMHFLKRDCLLLCAVDVPLDMPSTVGVLFLLCHIDSIYFK